MTHAANAPGQRVAHGLCIVLTSHYNFCLFLDVVNGPHLFLHAAATNVCFLQNEVDGRRNPRNSLLLDIPKTVTQTIRWRDFKYPPGSVPRTPSILRFAVVSFHFNTDIMV